MWHQRNAYAATAPGQMPPQAARYGYPPRMPPPQGTPTQPSAPSPGTNKLRVSFTQSNRISVQDATFIACNVNSCVQYPPQPTSQPQPVVTQQQQQQAYAQRQSQITGSYPPVSAQTAPAPAPLVPPTMSYSHQHHFPHGSVEATVISQKRRRKIMARELINVSCPGSSGVLFSEYSLF